MSEKGVLSARGARVDFDLMKIKEQIAAAPKTTTVKAREDFIDKKFKRRLQRQVREVVNQVTEIESEPEETEEPINEDQTIQEGLKSLKNKEK